MKGNITKRGENSWRIKYDVGTDANGKRVTQTHTVKGTKKQAQGELIRRLSDLADGRYVAPVRETVADYSQHWLKNIAPAARAPITIERYATLIRAHIIPGIGAIELQKLDGSAIDSFYASRREMGLAPLTLHHVHSLLGQILASAVKAKKLNRSPKSDIQTKPKPKRRDKIEVLDEAELAALLNHLRGHWLYMPSLVAASTGLRRGEVLGLRWQDLDLKKGTLQVAQAVESVGGKLNIKPPKTERSARTIKMPSALVSELERHQREQLEQRLKVGLGGRPEFVFTSPVGEILNPDYISEAFAKKAREVKPITFHGLRHTHITLLLKSGVPVHVVSARAGTRSPLSRSIPIPIFSAAKTTMPPNTPKRFYAAC